MQKPVAAEEQLVAIQPFDSFVLTLARLAWYLNIRHDARRARFTQISHFASKSRPRHFGDILLILRNIKAHADMALRPQMIDLIWLDLIDQFHQMDGIGEISVVKESFTP